MPAVIRLQLHKKHSNGVAFCCCRQRKWTTTSIRVGGTKHHDPHGVTFDHGMVNVNKGVLVKCDPAMKQFLLHLDETGALGSSFVLADLDDRHLFISSDIIPILKSRIDDLMDKLSFPITKQD